MGRDCLKPIDVFSCEQIGSGSSETAVKRRRIDRLEDGETAAVASTDVGEAPDAVELGRAAADGAATCPEEGPISDRRHGRGGRRQDLYRVTAALRAIRQRIPSDR